MQTQVITSTNISDLNEVLTVAKSFGGNSEEMQSIEDYLKNELADLGENRILFLLKEVDFGTIGTVQLILRNADDDPELADGDKVGHVHALQINKKFHRKGFGHKLMLDLELKTKEMGLDTLTLGVDSDNEKALKLYEKLGYKTLKMVAGRTPDIPLFYKIKKL